MLSLLHDDGDSFVITVRRDIIPSLPGRKDEVRNLCFSSFAAAEKFMLQRNALGWDIYVKHAVLVALPKYKGRPDCRIINIWGSRSFFADLDTGPNKPYGSIKDALAKIAILVKSKQLIRPNLITVTGHGLHLVWTLADILPANEWNVLKYYFYLYLKSIGLKTDPGAEPIDRGVRMCGAPYVNCKGGGQTPTRVLTCFQTRIPTDPFRAKFNPTGSLNIPTQSNLSGPNSSELSDEWSVRPDVVWNPQDSVDHCHIMWHARNKGGIGYPYPYWADLVALTSKATDEALGRVMAHEFSEHHVGYDATATDTMFNDFRTGPVKAHVLCSTLKRHAPELCALCHFNDKVKSPAGIPGAMARAGFLQTNPLPTTDYYNTQYGLMRQKRDKEEKDIMVWWKHSITDVRLAEGGVPYVCQLTFTDNVIGSNVATEVQLDMHTMPSVREFSAAMTTKGRVVTPTSAKELHLAMIAWVDAIRARRGGLDAYRRLGWVHLENPLAKGFVLGNQYYETGLPPAKFQPDTFMKNFMPTGTPSAYGQLVGSIMYNETRPEVHAHLAASLAAPLIKLTPATGGAVLNFYSSQSGAGKSTITNLAASMWGKPSSMMGGVDDTSNATIARLGTLNNLPFFYDEARPINPQEFTKTMLFRTNHGVEKRRLNSASQLQETVDWSTLNILTSNSSLGTALHTVKNHGDAAAARYLEFSYHPLNQANASNMDIVGRAVLGLETCYGHIGPYFAQILVDSHISIIHQLDNLMSKLIVHTRLDPSDNAGRLHAIAGACIILAAQMAIQHNLLPLDLKLVRLAVVNAMVLATRQRKESRLLLDPETVLDMYLRAVEAYRIRTTDINKTGRVLELNHPHVYTPVAYEINQTTREILVDLSLFHTHIADEGQNADSIIRKLRQTYTFGSRVIGYGTNYQSGSRMAIILPDQPPWSAYFI